MVLTTASVLADFDARRTMVFCLSDRLGIVVLAEVCEGVINGKLIFVDVKYTGLNDAAL